MRFVLSTAALLLIVVSAYAQGNHPQAGPQQGRPMQHQARLMQQQRQSSPEARQQPHHALPTPQQGRAAGPAHSPRQNREHAQPLPPAAQFRGGPEHGRISNSHYATRFGREHRFHVNQHDYDHRRFHYGGYAFGFVDPWPIDWSYSDDVYVVYDENGYYMYNRFHPGLRIAINIL